MTASKIAISLPEALLERARGAVRAGRAHTLSGYVARAIEETSKLDELETMLDDMLAATGGPLTAAERRAADRVLGVATAKRARTARKRA